LRKLFNTLFSAARAKITPLWTKLRFITSPSWWRTKGITKLRQAFTKLFDIRPKHRKDYYSIGRWLVSKRLAFALVIALAVLGLFYIFVMSPSALLKEGDGVSIRTYRYNAAPLKFYSGTVRILAKSKYVAYIGNVDGGEVTGDGTLYARDGHVVYEGSFDNCMYNGAGRLYYPSGVLEYAGSFTDNLYNGAGSFFRENGVVEYVGEYTAGARSGTGTLYNSGGNPVFTGSFRQDKIVFGEFLGKTTQDAAGMYTGIQDIYSTDSEYCVDMKEIGAAYAVRSGAKSLDDSWIITNVYVMGRSISVGGAELATVNELTAQLGTPIYLGSTWVDLSEAVMVNDSIEAGNTDLPAVSIDAVSTFDGVYNVKSYDTGFELYIYVYSYDGIIYTFYSDGSSSTGFFMYSLELAE
jgi:hypothetical protein